MKKVVFFSSIYPSETSIEKELEVLSSNFIKVIYIPLHCKKQPAKTHPKYKNVEYQTFNIPDNIKWTSFTKEQLLSSLSILIKYGSSFKEKLEFVLNLRSYLFILKKNLVFAELLEKHIENEQLEDAIFYDYWFENATLALAILKKRGRIKHFFSRAHGFDLYDYRWGNNMHVPFRRFKIKYIDCVYCISSQGQKYLRSKINKKYRHKVNLSYVGINTDTSINHIKDSVYTIVSASHTADFKRVHNIPELLKEISFPIRWVHFGSGPNDDKIKLKVKESSDNVKTELKGNVPNAEILKFYETNKVDAFVSLSSTEGLPISMMECALYGIPVFACNVGGIKDLVTKEVGRLFEPATDLEMIKVKFSEFIKTDFNRAQISERVKTQFNYKKNYSELYQDFIQRSK